MWCTVRTWKRAKDLMLMLGLNEIPNHLALAYRVHCCGHLLIRGCHVLKSAYVFVIDG